jgi:hypothetical protein
MTPWNTPILLDHFFSEAIPLAEAAYVVAAGGNPTLPESYALRGVITGAPTLSNGLADGGRFGFVARKTDAVHGDKLVVVFRGTRDRPEWIYDFDFIAEPCDFAASTQVHRGFQHIYRAVRESVLELTKDEPRIFFVEYIGHSLGGPLAAFAALDARRMFPLRPTPSLLRFESPRDGHANFCGLFGTLIPNDIRISNRGDIVPYEPRRIWGYEHHGIEAAIDSSGDPFAKYRHSLAAVRAGIMALRGTAAPAAKLA